MNGRGKGRESEEEGEWRKKWKARREGKCDKDNGIMSIKEIEKREKGGGEKGRAWRRV